MVALNGFAGGQAEYIASRFQWLPRESVVYNGVPDEVGVYKNTHVGAAEFPSRPTLNPEVVKSYNFRAVGSLTRDISCQEVPKVLDHFIAKLHAHPLLGNRPEQGLDHDFASVSAFV